SLRGRALAVARLGRAQGPGRHRGVPARQQRAQHRRLARALARPQFVFFTSTSMVTSTSSPTTSPPPSSDLLHDTLKSWRLMRVVATPPSLRLPIGSCIGFGEPCTVSTTALVTPRRVRSPLTLYVSSLTFSTCFDLNVMVGYLATSRKSAPRRWSSRFASPVS